MARVRRVPGAHWDRERRLWRAADSEAVQRALVEEGLEARVVEAFAKTASAPATQRKSASPGEVAKPFRNRPETGSPLPRVQQRALQAFTETLVRRQYAYNTRKSYAGAFSKYLRYLGDRPPDQIGKQDIEKYLLMRVRDDHISESYQNLLINAIKFYYEKVLGRDRVVYDIARPRRREPLPKVLSRDEVKRMLASTTNTKHRCMLMLLYGGGLRLSEVLALVPSDLDADRMTITIRRSKGKKDRVVPLPSVLLTPLREYFREYRPLTFLFEGQTVGERYSPRSLQQVVKQAAAKAGVQRPVTARMLRHSYATARQRGPQPHCLASRPVRTSATSRRCWGTLRLRRPSGTRSWPSTGNLPRRLMAWICSSVNRAPGGGYAQHEATMTESELSYDRDQLSCVNPSHLTGFLHTELRIRKIYAQRDCVKPGVGSKLKTRTRTKT